MVVAVDLDQADLAELAFADDPVAGLDQVRRAAALGADLHDPLVLARGGEHRLALDHVDADRLLHVDVGAGLDGGDHRQGVPVVGRGDQDDVEVLLLEHLAVVGVGPRRLLRGLARGDHLGGLGEHLLVDVAERDDLDRRDLDQAEQVALPYQPLPIRPTRFGSLIRECPGVTPERRPGEPGGAGLKKPATIHGTSPLPELKTHPTRSIHFSGRRAWLARGQSVADAGGSRGMVAAG